MPTVCPNQSPLVLVPRVCNAADMLSACCRSCTPFIRSLFYSPVSANLTTCGFGSLCSEPSTERSVLHVVTLQQQP